MTTQPRRLVLPRPVSKNNWHAATRGQAMRRSRIKKDWESQVWAQVNTFPRWPRNVASVTVNLVVFWDRPGPLPDHHNLDMAHECIADGLVKANILHDDAKGVYQRGTFSIVRAPRNTGRCQADVVLELAG